MTDNPEFEAWWLEVGESLTKHEVGLKDLMKCAYEAKVSGTQSALQLAYELGGTDEGNYFLNEEELLQVIWQHTNSQASEEPFAWVRECVVGEAFGSIMSFTCNKEDVTEHHEPVYKSTSGFKYKAELYDEVWELARKLGYNNVTDALSVTPIKE